MEFCSLHLKHLCFLPLLIRTLGPFTQAIHLSFLITFVNNFSFNCDFKKLKCLFVLHLDLAISLISYNQLELYYDKGEPNTALGMIRWMTSYKHACCAPKFPFKRDRKNGPG